MNYKELIHNLYLTDILGFYGINHENIETLLTEEEKEAIEQNNLILFETVEKLIKRV